MEALLEQISENQDRLILDDQQLIRLCQAGNSHGQEVLYKRFVNSMYHVCYRYLGDAMEAEDAVTEGFVKVLSKIGAFDYRGKGSLDGWVKRIMINESLMLLRKRKISKVDIDQVLDLEGQFTTDGNLEQMEVLKLVFELPKGYRTVFNMYVIEGYSHKEIAAELGISENTSKSQLSKARASLIKSLQKNDAL